MDVSADQIRAARGLLRIEQAELARRADVSVITIRRIESAKGIVRVAPNTLDGIRKVLEQAGAEFIPGGVRRVARDDRLFNDLRAISLESAARLRDDNPMMESDLYDEDGLPA